jgi:hypothetical protein
VTRALQQRLRRDDRPAELEQQEPELALVGR